MQVGTADPDELLGPRAVEMKRLDSAIETLEEVTVLQVLCEIDSQDACEMLPPALHPTIPPLVNWQAWSVPDSPWGAVWPAFSRLGDSARASLSDGCSTSQAASNNRWTSASGTECGGGDISSGG